MRAASALLPLLVAAGACGGAPAARPMAPPGPPVAAAASNVGAAVDGVPALHVVLRAPSTVIYDAAQIGIGGRHVAVQLTNQGAVPIDVRDLQVVLSVVDERGQTACDATGQERTWKREPVVLAPGASFTYERDLRCAIALPGTYDVRVDLAFGRAAELHRAGDFKLELLGRDAAPAQHPWLAGLYVGMAGNPLSEPFQPRALGSSDYAVVVALINGTRESLALHGARVWLRVYRTGTTIPCRDEPVEIEAPPMLGPGEIYTQRVPVACVVDTPGRYEVRGSLELDAKGSGHDADLGRISLRVTDEPNLGMSVQ